MPSTSRSPVIDTPVRDLDRTRHDPAADALLDEFLTVVKG
jgi:hypothetical protein